jgi:hypothetical protein
MRLVESGPSVTNEDVRIEIAARTIAGLEKGEPWPSNADLGGGPTGTRDDEYRDAMRDQAREVLEAVDAVTRPSSGELRALANSLRANVDWLEAGGEPSEHTWRHLRWIADRVGAHSREVTDGD